MPVYIQPGTEVRNTRHGRVTRVLVEGNDLSFYLREASINSTTNPADATAFADSIMQYQTSLPDYTASLSGMFDTGDTGPDTSVFDVFGSESKLRCVVANEGLQVGRRSRAFDGILTSYSLTNQLDQIVTFQSEMKVTGRLYVMTNMFDLSVPFATAALEKTFDRGTVGRIGVAGTNFKGGVYVMGTYTNTASFTITVSDSNLVGGTYTPVEVLTIPAGIVGQPFVAKTAAYTDINQFVKVTFSAVTGSLYAYFGLFDTGLSGLDNT